MEPRGAAVLVTEQARTVQMLPLSIRAEVGSVDDEARTVELTFSTGAAVERFDWMSGKRYLESLSLDPAHIRLDRLNAGGPLLNSHNSWDLAGQIGAVIPGTVRLLKNEARATVKLSRRAEVESIWQDIREGIIRSVSVGYRVYRFEETEGKNNALPIRKATDWEPFEVSMVPIPADAGAKVREGKSADGNSCEIVPAAAAAPPAQEIRAAEQPAPPNSKPPAAAPMPPKKETTMDDNRSETIREIEPEAPPPPKQAEPTAEERAATVERERCVGIMEACRAARLPQSFADKLIKDKTALGDARGLVLTELERREAAGPTRVPDARPTDAIVGEDPFVHKRAAIENALLHRVFPRTDPKGPGFELSKDGERYRGASLLDYVDIFLRVQGRDPRAMSKDERVRAVLSQRAMHSTADFPLLLADVANKALRAAYEAAPQTWRPISRQISLSDFKPGRQLQLGNAPALQEVTEAGEFKHGTITEAREQYQLKTYGRIFAITRQALLNDDLGAFAQVPMRFGQSARNLESDLAWAEITSNPLMGDNVALFHATHGNLDAAGADISINSIGTGRAAMRVQTDLDGATILNLSARYLIVPAALETVADQFTSAAMLATAAGSINPFAGRLTVVSEPRLDADSELAWYLATSPDQAPVLYYILLEGQGGPSVEQEVGFDIDGIKLKCRHDVAFKAADFRAIYKNVGAS